ncbi:MAG: hypothetical protein GY820_05870, partial [Gammaproteobacteria bacterium]|nr:hypothetical protein [Gammaproteobacteria bacterium]
MTTAKKKLVTKFAGFKPKMQFSTLAADLARKPLSDRSETAGNEKSTSDLPNKLSFAPYFLLQGVWRIFQKGYHGPKITGGMEFKWNSRLADFFCVKLERSGFFTPLSLSNTYRIKKDRTKSVDHSKK